MMIKSGSQLGGDKVAEIVGVHIVGRNPTIAQQLETFIRGIATDFEPPATKGLFTCVVELTFDFVGRLMEDDRVFDHVTSIQRLHEFLVREIANHGVGLPFVHLKKQHRHHNQERPKSHRF